MKSSELVRVRSNSNFAREHPTMSNVHGLNSYQNESKDNRNDDDDDNRLYVGGASQHGGGSGLNVIGNPEGGASDHVQNIFARAMAESASGPTTGASGAPPRIITFYQNGFTVDGGAFRAKTDPANENFLNDMQRGIVPRELESQAQNEQVGIHVIDKRQELYVPPAYTAFGGAGQAMGWEFVVLVRNGMYPSQRLIRSYILEVDQLWRVSSLEQVMMHPRLKNLTWIQMHPRRSCRFDCIMAHDYEKR